MPAYSEKNTGNKHLPDYRTTLMWKPDVIIHGSKSQSINIPTSDYKGSFKIIFQGISGKGEPIYAEKLFEVH